MIDHVTYEVPRDGLQPEYGHLTNLQAFFAQIGFKEVQPDAEIEGDWNVVWYQNEEGFQVHLVEAVGEDAGAIEEILDRGLDHFAVIVPPEKYEQLKGSSWRENIGRGEKRIWLQGPFRLRVEVRPATSLPSSVKREERPEGELGQSVSDHTHAFAVSAVTPYSDAGGIQLVGAAKDPSVVAQADVLIKALGIYQERNRHYKDNWRRYGWRGLLYDLRRKVERVWDKLWDADPEPTEGVPEYDDDLLDVINYAAMAARAETENNRDGEGAWWNE